MTQPILLPSSPPPALLVPVMAPTQAASKKKESKEDRLAQLKELVTNLEGSFHQRKLVPASLRQHDVVWQSWQDFAVTIGISPEVTHG
jgi:hypothetical protein